MYMAYSQTNQSRTPHRSSTASKGIAIKASHTKAILRFVLIAVILGTVFSFGAIVQAYAASTTAPTASASDQTVSKAAVQEKIVIQTGDTLWDIAAEHKKRGENIRSYMDKIKSINHLKTSSLSEGQVLFLP